MFPIAFNDITVFKGQLQRTNEGVTENSLFTALTLAETMTC